MSREARLTGQRRRRRHASKQASWSKDLAHKVLRYLAGTAEQGLLMTASGDEAELHVYSDAGFAGADTRSQNGLVIF